MTTTDPNRQYLQVLLAHADQTERQERLAAESVDALRASGAFAMRTPVADGGLGADATTVARRLSAYGWSCPSAAWVAGTCATAKTMLAGSFADRVPKEAFTEPDAMACGSGTPTARGVRAADGIRVTGRWANISGCEDADWAGLALMVGETYCFAYLPVGELAVERTWHVAGMRGTGSHTLVADGLLVPERWVTPAALPAPGDRLFYAITVLAPVVGAACGALHVITTMFASDRNPFMTSYSRMGESPGARQWLAEASFLVTRAEQAMLDVAGASARDGQTDLDSAHWAMTLAGAARDCRAAAERMLDLHGASGLSSSNPLQRYWRDIAVGSRHPHLNPYLAVERLGSALA